MKKIFRSHKKTSLGGGRMFWDRVAGVYDMGGKKVAKAATSLKTLPVGTYIIGGRKVTVER